MPKQTLWTFHAHKSVLVCCSGHFRELLSEKSKSGTTGPWEDEKYDMTVRSFDGFQAIMRFVYTADERQLFKTVDANVDLTCREKVATLIEIMMQAHELGMGGVQRLCAKRFCTSVTLLSEDTILKYLRLVFNARRILLACTALAGHWKIGCH